MLRAFSRVTCIRPFLRTLKTAVVLNESDLQETFTRGGGNGGQKINKTANRCNLLHLPTGLRVQCQVTRSLAENRKIARKMLKDKLDQLLNGDQSRIEVEREKERQRKRRRAQKAKRKYGQHHQQEDSFKMANDG